MAYRNDYFEGMKAYHRWRNRRALVLLFCVVCIPAALLFVGSLMDSAGWIRW